VVLVDNQADAQTWRSQKFKISGVTHFQFEPMTSTNATGGVYMNWYGDVDKNPLDNQTITVGFWSSDGNNDVGSRWVLEVPEFNTYTVVAETGNVTIHGETYDNGETISVLGELSQGEVVAAKQEGKFAVVNIDHAAKTITVTYLDMPELRESAPYTQAWVYPKQQDAVGEAQTEIEGNVYTLYNNVLAASFMKVDKSVYFLGSKAMNLEAGSDLFIVGFGDGESVAASQMELKSFEAKELSANVNAIGGAEHFAGKALEAVFGYTYANEEIEIVWRAVLRDGSHYLRTEMELTGKGNVDMYDVIAMNYNVDTKAAGSKPVALGNTRGKVIMNNRIFAGLETPMAYNTAGDATNENDNWTMVVAPSTDNLEVASWTAMDIAEVPMRVQEVAGSDKTYYTYTKNVELKNNQKVVVTVSYKSGAKRFDLDGTDLLDQNGSVAVSDYHHGFTGTSKENNSFSMIAPNDGTFTLRTFCDNREGDLVSSCEYKVEVFEAKTEDAVTSEIVNMQGRWSRNVVLKAGETWKVAAVVGLIAQDGTQDEADVRKTQKRRSFLAYSERERAVPWRAFPCYISWYELNINRNNAPAGEEHTNMQIGPVMDVLKVWKEKMYDKYGVGPASFIIE
jgi:hypothetical protein